MTKVGRNTRIKRSAAPGFWKIPRKRYRFATATRPGPHPRKSSYPLLLLVRDILGYAKTYREARSVIIDGGISVDGLPRKEPSFPVGLMDVVEIPSVGKAFRIIPREGNLYPLDIPESEKSQKLCRVESKVNIKDGKLQYGTHDGRTFLSENKLSVERGDSLLVEVPSHKILGEAKMGPNTLALVIAGSLSGKVCEVLELIPGTYARERSARVRIDESERELPTSILLPTGKGKPLIKITGG